MALAVSFSWAMAQSHVHLEAYKIHKKNHKPAQKKINTPKKEP